MAGQVICTMFKHPWGKESESTHSKTFNVQLYITPGWRLVKIQWEISVKECYGFMHVRYNLSKSGEDIQAEIYNEETRACKWGFHVCGLCLPPPPPIVTPVFSLTLSLSLLARVFGGEMFLWTLWLPRTPADFLTMFFFSHLCLKCFKPLYFILFDNVCYILT